jgi:hypothetical protein
MELFSAVPADFGSARTGLFGRGLVAFFLLAFNYRQQPRADERKWDRRVPRYYFIIRATGGSYDDPVGTDLPDVAAAKAYARRIIQELKEGAHPTEDAMLDVQDEARNTILTMPFEEG